MNAQIDGFNTEIDRMRCEGMRNQSREYLQSRWYERVYKIMDVIA